MARTYLIKVYNTFQSPNCCC